MVRRDDSRPARAARTGVRRYGTGREAEPPGPVRPARTGPGTGTLAVPRSRRATLAALTAALVDGRLELSAGSDPDAARAALRDPDAFLPTDLGTRRAARALRLPGTPGALVRHAAAWRP